MLPDKLRWDLELWYQGGPKFKGGPMNPNDAMVYILYTKTVQDVYNWCKQNVYKLYPIFWQTFVYILYTKSKDLWQLNFDNKM